MLQIIDSRKIADFKLLPLIGPAGVYAYVMSFIFPVKWDFPMILLVAAGTLATVLGIQKATTAGTHRINFILAAFLLSMAGSSLVSINFSRSLHLAVVFLPALFIYFLIIEQFATSSAIRLLYLCFSITAFGISVAALYYATAKGFHIGDTDKEVHILAGTFSYIIVSRNDLTFLSIMAPFSFILAYRKPFGRTGLFAIFSMILSLCTVVVFQSRGASLTFFITLLSVAVLLEPKKALWLSLIAAVLFLLADASLDFALFKRFYGVIVGTDELTNGRRNLWWIVLKHFKDAPFLGHGPHTFGAFSRIPWPHNLYLEVLFGQGLVGLSTFIALLVYSGKTAWNLRLTTSLETRCYAMAALAALIGFCASSIVELTFLRLWVTVTLFMILGIIVRLSSTKNQIKLNSEGVI